MRNLLGDLRFAIRVLRNSPGFAVVAVATLGLGIAANTTVFGWIDAVLLHPITGVQDAGQLAVIEGLAPDGRRLGSRPHPDFRDYQRQLTLASGVAAFHTAFFTVGPPEHPQRVMGQVASANAFAVLGVKPYLGRTLLVEEDRDAFGAYPLAVISYRLWRGYFRADPAVVGQVIRINGHQLTIVGVAPPDFRGTVGGLAMDIWVPLSQATQMGSLNTWAADDRNAAFLNLIVRLKSGVAIEQARAEVQGVAARIAATYPDTHRGIGATLVPVREASDGVQKSLRDPLRILMGVCVLVLLIACANVANLLLARSLSRQREFGVRLALGAGRGRLVAQVLLEVLLLASAGALFGVLLARWLQESLVLVFPAMSATIWNAAEPLLHPKPSWSVLLFATLVSIGAALLSTILPALAVSRMDVNQRLKEGGRGGTAGVRAQRSRGLLVVAEVALAAMALIGAGLALRSFQKLATIDPGFDPHHVLVAHFYLSSNGYSLDQEKQFDRNLRLRLEAAPGIEQVTYADSVPLSFFGHSGERIQTAGSLPDDKGVISLSRTVTAPGYFDLLRIPLLAGRDFTERDDGKAPAVIVVNQSFARRYFPGEDPIGRQVRVSGNVSTIVGLVKDTKYRNPGEGPTPYFYAPFAQIFFSGYSSFVYLRTNGDLNAARATLRRAAASLDSNSGLYEALPLTEYTQAGLFAERIAACLMAVLGIVSVLLAAVGLYSVIAYSVSERTHEIGIRMALGAGRGAVLAMVLRTGLAMTLAGIVAGTVLVFVIARMLSGSLDSPIDIAQPGVFVAAALSLLLIAFLASYLPARRATRVDPMIALRSE